MSFVFDNMPGNTALQCQQAIMKEIRNITEGMLFQDAGTKEPTEIRIYEQRLPINHDPVKEFGEAEHLETIDFVGDQAEDAILAAPWCTVKIDKGQNKDDNGYQNVKFAIIFGIYSDEPENNGHRDALNLIENFMYRFTRDPILEGQYVCKGDFDWEINEEDTFPYTFAVITTWFQVQTTQREGMYL